MSNRPDTDGEAIATFREARRYARGGLDVDHSDLYEWAGLVDDPLLREVLAFMAEVYDPDAFGQDEMPAHFRDTEFFRRAVSQSATEAATEAIKERNPSRTAYISGLPSYESDVSGLHAVDQLADWLVNSEAAKLVYLAGHMGAGKTDFALTCFQVVHRHFRRLEQNAEEETPTPRFAANVRVSTPSDAPEVKTIRNYDDLEEWAKTVGGSSDAQLWYILDESSTHLTAQSGSNAQDVAEVMAPFIKRMRKLGVNILVIGHDKKDIHVAIRSLADFVNKRGKKSATFYSSVRDREGVGELFTLAGIPSTSWEFDTDDMASWSWGSALEDGGDGEDGLGEVDVEGELREERNERIARLYAQTDLSYRDLATAFEISNSTVSNAVDSHDIEHIEGEA